MDDLEAAPENVSGQIVQKHVFEHQINWGYVAVALAVSAGAYALYRANQGEDER